MRMWLYHGAGVNRPDRIAIRSRSKNSGMVWESSKSVYNVVEKTEFLLVANDGRLVRCKSSSYPHSHRYRETFIPNF